MLKFNRQNTSSGHKMLGISLLKPPKCRRRTTTTARKKEVLQTRTTLWAYCGSRAQKKARRRASRKREMKAWNLFAAAANDSCGNKGTRECCKYRCSDRRTTNSTKTKETAQNLAPANWEKSERGGQSEQNGWAVPFLDAQRSFA